MVYLLAAACVAPPPAPKPVNLTTANPAPATAASAPALYARSALSNTRQKVDTEYYVNADCTTGGIPAVVVTTPPSNGTLWTEPGTDYPLFNKDNQRYECNKMAIAGTGVFYKSNEGFYGTDTATIHVINPNGTFRDVSYSIIVK
jgi:hypothetical protein